MLGLDQAEVIDAGRGRWCRELRLRHLAVDVATDDERDRLTHGSPIPEHVQSRQILRIKTQLDAPTDEGRVDAVVITGQRHRGGAGDAPHHRPAEGFAQQGWFDRRQRTVAGEAGDRRLAGLGVLAGIAHLLTPGQKAVVELGEAGDAVRLGLTEEPLADEAVQPLLLAAPLGRVGSAMDKTDAEYRTAALEGGIGIRRTVIHVQPLGQTAALDGGAQHVLASARVLVWHPAAVDQQPRIIVDEDKEVSALAARHARMGRKRADQHVADPHLVGS